MKRPVGEVAQRQLARIRRLVAEAQLPFDKKTDEQVIRGLRKTREELWDAKGALRPR